MTMLEWSWSPRIEPVLQSEAAECGIACLTMVGRHHGHRIDLATLRRRAGISVKGATLTDLIRVAADIGLSSRPLRLELDELAELRLPAVLHWELNHFVVIESLRNGKATILDPALGRRTLPVDRLSRFFTGVALELEPAADFAPLPPVKRPAISQLWTRMTGLPRALGQVLALSVVLQLTALALPFFMQLTIDQAVAQGDLTLLNLLALGFGALYILNALLQALRSWVVLTLGQSVAYQLAGNVVRHLIRLPAAFFERRHVGDIQSRVASVRPIQDLLTHGFVDAGVDAALAATLLAVMAILAPMLALVVLVFLGLYVGTVLALLPAWQRRINEQLIARAHEESHLLETIRGIRTIKLSTSEALREAGWRSRMVDDVSAGYRAEMIAIRMALAEQLLLSIQLLVVVWMGAAAVIGDRLTIGQLLAFLAYRTSFNLSTTQLVGQVRQWRLSRLHLDRLADITGEPPEEVGRLPARPNAGMAPEIRVENLSFTYSPGERPIFHDINFTVPAGSLVSIVGPSGAGKTTLLRILLGLLPPSGGRILIDGVPLTPHTLAAWRSRIGAVLQDDLLFAGTFADNIAAFDQRYDQAQVEEAARLAYIHDDIIQMPMGYQSLITDMGAALSGGQRQRMLLARALHRGPDLLVLDEGTANLDPKLEERVSDAIATMPITRIAIAHRPALIERSALVVEMAHGACRVLGRGALMQAV
jgi:ATP-binding cassette subfamily B protein RaxB